MTDRNLQLERPIVSIDLETTGLDAANDRIVEISCVKLLPDGSRDVRTRRVNPGVPISAEATSIHGISDADVASEPSFAQLAKNLHAFLAGCDLTGFNLEHFDIPMLQREFKRVGLDFPQGPVRVLDSRRVFLIKEPRDLRSAYRYYCGRELEQAHSAEADAKAAADILLAQVARYADLPLDVGGMHDFCHPQHPDWIDPDGKVMWKGDDAVLTFGKHRDRPLKLVVAEAPDYLEWVCTKANFSPEVVSIVRAALRGKLPERKAT